VVSEFFDGTGVRHALKSIAFGVALIVVLPAWLSYQVRRRLLGADRALMGSTQALSLVPGLWGQFLRRAFLWLVLDSCASSVTVEFGTIFSKISARIGENVYIGPHCSIGSVHIDRDVLIAPGVHIPSGPRTHGTEDPLRPIKDQTGALRTIHVGRGSWIGTGAVVLSDVGANTVVGAGAVVTNALPDNVIAAGVPARVVRDRTSP
jgi:virginiamycin A acetyltransferase